MIIICSICAVRWYVVGLQNQKQATDIFKILLRLKKITFKAIKDKDIHKIFWNVKS